MQDGAPEVQGPMFKWEWNPNTIVVLCGFAAGFVAWGYALNDLRMGRETNAANIAELRVELRALSGATDENRALLANHELRLSTRERQGDETAVALRALEQTIGVLASDVRLAREIMERLERSQSKNSDNR